MKEYKRKRRDTDLVQQLSAGQYNFEVILNPAGEQQRLTEQKQAEAQIQLKKSSLPEQHPDIEPVHAAPDTPHTSFSPAQVLAFISLLAILAATVIYALVR